MKVYLFLLLIFMSLNVGCTIIGEGGDMYHGAEGAVFENSISYPPSPNTDDYGQVCVTQTGTCILKQPIPVGRPCFCTSPYGMANGVVYNPSEERNYGVVEVYFATDRKQNKSSNIQSMFGADRGVVQYGITSVSIPRDHRMGELESPSVLKLEFREDPEKHVVMLNIKTLNKAEYYKSISQKIKKSKKKSAFLFIHGYNVTFEDAARRTAQISYDLAFDGASVFYSWPSHGSTARYTFDETNIKWSQKNIERFLEDFSERSNAENIYLIAHSMGNRALTRAYISLLQKKPSLKSLFKEIILAAPDIDAEVFKRDIAPEMVKAGSPVTLYASSEDIPLRASRAVHGGYPRAGDSGEDIILLSGIESIDSTNVKTSFLGHSYYADQRSIISDIFYIFKEGLRASERAGLNEKTKPNGGQYWEFKK